MHRALLVIALLSSMAGLAVAGPSPTPPRAPEPAVDRGHQLATRRCAQCHAVRPGRESPDGDAPRFSTLRLRFNEISLQRRLAEIPWGRHAGMPPVGLTDADRSDLAAYIESLPSPRG